MAGIGYTSENKFGATVLIAAVGIAMIIGVLATMLFMTMRSNNHAATTPPNDSDFAAIAATSSSTTTSTPMTVTTTIAPTTTAAPPTTTTIAQSAELEARVQRRFKAVTNGNVDDAWALTSDVCKDGTTYNQFEAEVQYQSQNNNGLTIVSIDKIDITGARGDVHLSFSDATLNDGVPSSWVKSPSGWQWNNCEAAKQP